jgi:hypothetical protein
MCVRNAVLSAWTTLEMACCDSLEVSKLPGRDFKEGLKKTFTDAGKPTPDFGSGIWQGVLRIKDDHRNDYAHVGGKIVDLFPKVVVAEDAIRTIREAIHDVYAMMGKQSPSWVDTDQSSGWPTSGNSRATAHLTLVRGQLDQNASDTLRIVLVTEEGNEKVTDYFPGTTPEEDVYEQVEDLLGRLGVPFSRVRVYRGPDLLYKEDFDMRG